MENRKNLIVIGVVIVIIILSVVVWTLVGSGDDSNNQSPNTATQESASSEDQAVESDDNQEVSQNENDDSNHNQQSPENETDEDQPVNEGNSTDPSIDVESLINEYSGTGTIPPNWDDLSSRDKVRINPYGCFDVIQIRADNGQCLAGGSSLDLPPFREELLSVLNCREVVVIGNPLINFHCAVEDLDSGDIYDFNAIENHSDNIWEYFNNNPPPKHEATWLDDCVIGSWDTWYALPTGASDFLVLMIDDSFSDSLWDAIYQSPHLDIDPVWSKGMSIIDVCDGIIKRELLSSELLPLLNCIPEDHSEPIHIVVEAYGCTFSDTGYSVYLIRQGQGYGPQDAPPEVLCQQAGNNIVSHVRVVISNHGVIRSNNYDYYHFYLETWPDNFDHDYSELIDYLVMAGIQLSWELNYGDYIRTVSPVLTLEPVNLCSLVQ